MFLEPWRRLAKGLSEFDLIALFQGHDRFFPMWLPAKRRGAFALLFAGVIAGVHRDDPLLEQLFDGLPDFNLVGVWMNAKHILVQGIAQQSGLLDMADRL